MPENVDFCKCPVVIEVSKSGTVVGRRHCNAGSECAKQALYNAHISPSDGFSLHVSGNCIREQPKK